MTKSATLASEAYGRLRSDIIDGAIKPGAKLKIRTICDQYGIGASPVREALNRLASEGLLDHRDQRGFRVHSVTLQDLDELILARCWANEVGLRNSIRSGGLAWEEGVTSALQRLEAIPRYLSDDTTERNPAWEQAHGAFHAALVAASGSSWINDFCTQLYVAAQRYRHAARTVPRAGRNEQDEHRAIAQAAIARRENEAVELLMEHFRLTARLVRAALRQDGM
ncbi:GntR family transcriptional regulator [Xanthobacter sp. 126]|uniref:GntR family transcriptional regulator n=1 Tax=Xanthobacter sp. 126 TaxID=1131814 RepID=UPI00045E7B58|nr:GntR family transcriptional regulator [Xanthobacter sp. 126]